MRTCEECGRDVPYDELPDHLYGHLHHRSEILDWLVKDTLPRVRGQVVDLFEAVLARHRNHSPVFEDLCCRLVTDNDIMYTVVTQAQHNERDEDLPIEEENDSG